jgi:predicted nucleic acid-binding protein
MDEMMITDASAVMTVVVYEPARDYVIQLTNKDIRC